MIDFATELRKQMRFIQGSAALFDAGNPDESIRIAIALDVIFNDEGRYKTLPEWEDLKKVQMVSTCTKGIEKPDYMLSNLIALEIAPSSGLMRFRPSLSIKEYRLLTLEKWWKGEVIFRSKDTPITRRDLALWARNTDGGAHIQKKHKSYEWLFSGAGWAMELNPIGRKSRVVTAKNAHLAALRQIAFEIQQSESIQSLWHPRWNATHRITTKPNDSGVLSRTWNVMCYKQFAYSQDEWESHKDPQWAVSHDGHLELLGEPPCIGLIEIERLRST